MAAPDDKQRDLGRGEGSAAAGLVDAFLRAVAEHRHFDRDLAAVPA